MLFHLLIYLQIIFFCFFIKVLLIKTYIFLTHFYSIIFIINKFEYYIYLQLIYILYINYHKLYYKLY